MIMPTVPGGSLRIRPALKSVLASPATAARFAALPIRFFWAPDIFAGAFFRVAFLRVAFFLVAFFLRVVFLLAVMRVPPPDAGGWASAAVDPILSP
jgi:hypothetical protein